MANGAKVLLVDDDRAFIESGRDLLESHGYAVLTACDGASGLEVARRERPDVMVLDVMMATETEGFDVSRALPRLPELSDMAVLLVTGIRRNKHLPFGLEPDETWLPVDGIMEKPVVPEQLLQKLRSLLDR